MRSRAPLGLAIAAVLATAIGVAPAEAVVGPTVPYRLSATASCVLGPGILNVKATSAVELSASGPAYVGQSDAARFTAGAVSLTWPASWSTAFDLLGANVVAGDVRTLLTHGQGLSPAAANVAQSSSADVLELNQWGRAQPGHDGQGLAFGPMAVVSYQSDTVSAPVLTAPETDTTGDPIAGVDPPVDWDAPTGAPSTFAVGSWTVTGGPGSSVALTLDTAAGGVTAEVDGFAFTDTSDLTVAQYGNPPEMTGYATADGMPATPLVAGPFPISCSTPAGSTPAQVPVAAAPSVTTQPTAQSVDAGATATFHVAGGGVPAPTVQWQSSTDGGSTWSDIAGATADTLTIPDALTSQSGEEYRAALAVNVTNDSTVGAQHVFTVGTAVSDAAVLNVAAPPTTTTTSSASATPSVSSSTTSTSTTTGVAPVVTQQPGDQTVAYGETASFTAAASGVPLPTVQWQVSTDGGATFTNLAGASSDTLTVSAAGVADNGNLYRAVFTNAAGSATSTAARLTTTLGAGFVTTQPTSLTLDAGHTATFTSAAAGNPAPAVQWQVSTDGGATFSDVAGATSDTLSFTATLADDGNEYRAVFTWAGGTSTSNVATLTVDAPPAITQQPADQSVAAGQTATFTAAASGKPAPSVQWQVSTDGGATFTDVAGATSPTLGVSGVSASQNGTEYRAVFTNGQGSATTDAATLYVNGPVVSAMFPHRGGPFSIVLIEGRNLGGAKAVHFGTRSTLFLSIGNSFVIALAPFGPSGTVDVTVTTDTGTSSTSSADRFSYSGFIW